MHRAMFKSALIVLYHSQVKRTTLSTGDVRSMFVSQIGEITLHSSLHSTYDQENDTRVLRSTTAFVTRRAIVPVQDFVALRL